MAGHGPAGTLVVPDDVHRRRWVTLAVLCLSLVVIVMDNTILNVALPTLVRDIHASTSQLQWIVDSYTLVFASLLLTAGALGDRFGRKGALTLGLAIFGGGSISATLSSSAAQLVACRAVMGIGGALIMPATLSILTNVFRDPNERARAISIWAATSGIGVVVGPVTGGWLLEHFSWHSVFWLNVPIVGFTMLAGRLVPRSKDPDSATIDLLGAALSTSGLIALVWSIIEAPSHGWGSGTILGGFAVAAVLLGLFAAWEIHTDEPMLDLRFFKNKRFSGANMAITLTFFAMFGSMFLLSQYLQFVKGYSPLGSGVRMMPMALGMMVASPLSAKLVQSLGTKLVVGVGLVVVAAGLGWMATLGVDTSYPALAARIIVMAIGMGFVMAPATESVMGSLPPSKAGVGSAVNDTTRELGGALGVAVIGSLVSSVFTSHLTNAVGSTVSADGLREASASLGAAMAVGNSMGGEAGNTFVQAAKVAFVDGLTSGLWVGAAAAIAGAVIVAVFLPARAADPQVVHEIDDTAATLQPASGQNDEHGAVLVVD